MGMKAYGTGKGGGMSRLRKVPGDKGDGRREFKDYIVSVLLYAV